MVDYANISIPRALIDHITELLKELPELGYRSPAEFIIEITRQASTNLESRLKDKKSK